MPAPTSRERASKYVSTIPPAVSGASGHNDTFRVACVLLQGFDLPRSDARAVLDEFNARCQPPWSDKELEHKLNQAAKMSGLDTREGMKPRGCLVADSGGGSERPPALPSRAPSVAPPKELPKKPEFDVEKLRAFAARWRPHVDTAWLADRSPCPPYSLAGCLPAADFLRALYAAGEKVVVFTNQRSQGQCLWPKQGLPMGGDEGVHFLCQPVDGLEHINPREGLDEKGKPKTSRRSEESVTAWRFLVLESDEADARDWLAALVQFSPLKIAAIYTSGGRSIHALVRVDAPSKNEWDNLVKQLKPELVTMGADPRAMSAVRLTRLPNCWRGVKMQKLLFLNPQPAAVAICTLPRLRDSTAPWIGAAATLMTSTAAELREWDQWESVENTLAALRWFESSPPARASRDALKAWSEAS